ncbi:YqjK family protein [Solimicrobium silvestre]|uniref:YqjK-like protein n=1 Tax=Solimicrobium silvestre TaxID=2099400 RepID=A0A2S9GUZ3_9BURK|nr:YqjK family protein [Solimicrobium silvestre]PRC91547.1 YqjK-like protein [Solimicrobium silvestre]
MSRTKQLAMRRSILVAECALQRTTLAAQSHALGRITGWISASNGLVERLKNMPGWVSALLAGMLVLMPGRAVSLARNGLMIWQIWRNLKSNMDSK